MKKIFVLTLLLVLVLASTCLAANWSKYESGRNNIRLDGYDGQPGYIKFTDGSGTNCGYLFAAYDSAAGDYRLMYATPSALDLTTTKLIRYYGVAVDLE